MTAATVREFPNEVHRIAAVLQDDKGEWERRLTALQQLRALFEQDPSGHPEYMSLMTQFLKMGLKEQIEDLRSSISKEACACVKSLCICTGNHWEAVSEWYVAALLSNTCATVAVISEAADDALATITSCGVVSNKALQAYLHGTSAKHSTIRRSSFAALLRILTHCERGFVQKHGAAIAKVIRPGLTDAVQAPRQLARLSFWALESVCKEEADRLSSSCEAAVQRTLQQEQGSFYVWMQEGKLPDSCNPVKRGITQRGNTNTASSARLLKANSARTIREEHPSSPVEPTPAPGSTSPPTAKAATAEAKAANVLRRPATSINLHNTSKVAPSSHADPMAGASTAAPAPASARPASRSRPRSASAHARDRQPAVDTTDKKTTATKVRVPAAATRPRTARGGSTAPVTPLGPDDGWLDIVKAVQSSDWSQRVNALGSISELLELGALSHDVEALSLIMERIGDSHFKVSTAAFQTFQRLLDTKPDVACPQLERLMMLLFPKLTDQKLKDVARSALDACGNAFGPEVLFPVLTKVVDNNNQRIRPGCMEFISHLATVPNAARYFAAPQSMRLVGLKLLAVAKGEKSSANMALIKGTLAQLYAHNAGGFTQLVLSLSHPEQAGTFELLKAKIPHLAQDCKRFAAGDRPLPHAPTGLTSEAAYPQPAMNSTTPNAAFGSPQAPSYPSTKRISPSPVKRGIGPISEEVIFERPGAQLAAMSAAAADFSKPVGGQSPQQRLSVGGPSASSVTSPPSAASPVGVAFNPQSYDPTTNKNADRFAEVSSPKSQQPASNSRLADPLLSPGSSIQRIKELMLLRNAVSTEERRDAIRIAANSLQHNETLWLEHYAKFLPFALAFARESDHGLRVLSFRWLLGIVSTNYLQASNEAAIEHFARVAHHGIDDAFPEVRAEAGALAVEAFSRCRPASNVVALLTLLEDDSVVMHSSGKALTFLIDQVGKAVGGVAATQGSAMWIDYLPRVVNAVMRHADSAETDVRKAVVLALVDFFHANHESLLPLIAGMPPAKLRLLEMYINKGGRDGMRPVEPVIINLMLQERQLVPTRTY